MFEQVFRNIDDIRHKDAGCTSELDYTEPSSWLWFLKYLDALEKDKATQAELFDSSSALQRRCLQAALSCSWRNGKEENAEGYWS